MVVEIIVISSDCLVLKFVFGSVIGKISMIIVSGNRVIRYCLMLNRFIYWVVNLCLFSSREKLIRLLVMIIIMEQRVFCIKVGVVLLVVIKVEIKLILRIIIDRFKIRELQGLFRWWVRMLVWWIMLKVLFKMLISVRILIVIIIGSDWLLFQKNSIVSVSIGKMREDFLWWVFIVLCVWVMNYFYLCRCYNYKNVGW